MSAYTVVRAQHGRQSLGPAALAVHHAPYKPRGDRAPFPRCTLTLTFTHTCTHSLPALVGDRMVRWPRSRKPEIIIYTSTQLEMFYIKTRKIKVTQ